MKTRLIIYTKWKRRWERETFHTKKSFPLWTFFTPTHDFNSMPTVFEFFTNFESCHMALFSTVDFESLATSHYAPLTKWMAIIMQKYHFFPDSRLRRGLKCGKFEIECEGRQKFLVKWEKIYLQHETGAFDWKWKSKKLYDFLWVFARDMNYVCSRYPHSNEILFRVLWHFFSCFPLNVRRRFVWWK